MADHDPAGLRPSRDDREPYLTAIGMAAADGRIDAEELDRRVEAVESATTIGRLDEQVADIPFPWRDEQVQRAVRATRRRFLLSAAGTVAIGGLSWWATRSWMDANPRPAGGEFADNGRSTEPAAASTPASGAESEGPESGVVATELFEVANWQADTFPSVIGFARKQGIVRIVEVSASRDRLDLSGVTNSHEHCTLGFRLGRRPEVDRSGERVGAALPTLPASTIEGLDMATLLSEARASADLSPDVEDISLTIRFWPKLWTVGIRDSDHEVYWRTSGARWDPETEWDATQ